MTTLPLPRWLALSMLPVLTAVAIEIHLQPGNWIANWAMSRNIDGFSSMIVLLWIGVGPFLAGCAIAHPLARFSGADWKLPSLAVAFPIVAMSLHDLKPQSAFGYFFDALTPSFFVLFIAGLAAGAHRALLGSRLVIAPSPAAESSTALPEPLALQLSLVPMFALAFFFLYDSWPEAIRLVGKHFESEALREAWLALCRVAGPTLFALAFAFPIARIYGRRAAYVAAVAPLLSVWWWGSDYLSRDGSAFRVTTRIVEIALLLLLPPLAAAWAARRFRGTRLAISR